MSKTLKILIFLFVLASPFIKAADVTLAWDPVQDTNVLGYKIYWGADSRNYYTNQNAGLVTTNIVSGLVIGSTYYFAATAYATNGLESDFSNEVVYTVPGGVVSNTPPTIIISSPANNQFYSAPASIDLVSTVVANGNVISKVQFFTNSVLINEDLSSPYSFLLSGVLSGSYTLGSKVFYSSNSLDALPVNITVTNIPVVTGGLVAYYSFDENSGTTALDSSGNSNHGSIGTATWSASGKRNSALNFSGSAKVTVPDSSSLDLVSGMTLEAWVKPTVTPTDWSTILLKEQSGGLVYALYSASSANRPNVYINISGDQGVTGPTALPLNAWSHLAATYDGAVMRLYANGIQVSSTAITGSMPNSTGALSMGGNGVWGEYFRGLIDEVKIYNRALSIIEIQNDMNSNNLTYPQNSATNLRLNEQ